MDKDGIEAVTIDLLAYCDISFTGLPYIANLASSNDFKQAYKIHPSSHPPLK